ncbi:MHS family MFS transporter [Pseudoflavitalea sp. X16]|uniref:MFS transporter n=1 Tax=Paraflavitalea devenefica TaxID=2716334 RepID=UPI00141FE9CD|nr:MFS transporter [Paraflavitalea devenefica]NII24175.1 MHS family MFS transporter [Paraflavitalea devenefica]
MNKTTAAPAAIIRQVIIASSVGTMIEWYDFYIFGMLAKTISTQFFPEGNATAALLSTLAIFAAGFIVRPFGALVFGRLGDLIGRKYTFLLTLILMGGSTFLIGLVPGYKSIGMAAPLLVLTLRLVQGLALGGEYGGAATYVAEFSPPNKRGYYTSWIQTTATLGLFVALGVIMLVKLNMTDEQFNAPWGGWRYPFWVSIFLVIVSIYIRMKMEESPLFSKLKKEGKTSTNPLKESFRHKANFKMVLLALFGAVMGQGVIWYTGQFYAQSFLETKCSMGFEQSRTIMLWAIAFATPFFLLFGWLSDRIGRKWIMLGGMLLGVLLYRPIFTTFLKDTDIKEWQKTQNTILKKETSVSVHKTDSVWQVTTQYETPDGAKFTKTVTDTLTAARPVMYQATETPKNTVYSNKEVNGTTYIKFIFLVWIMIVLVTMVYGPIAAFLVEMFPTKIRYTSMSLPYHIGNGVFGGLVPFIGLLLTTTYPKDPLVGLWYPIGIAALCFIIGSIYLNNRIDKDVTD